MMKRLLLLAIGIGALNACAPAPAPAPPPRDTKADEAKLAADAAIWFDYVAKGDADAVANLYAEDALILPDKAPAVHGRAAMKAYMTATIGELKAAGLSFKDGGPTGVSVSGDMGWVSGTYSVVDAKGATVDTGKYLSVHHREGESWPYIRDIWNSDVAPPPAPAPKK